MFSFNDNHSGKPLVFFILLMQVCVLNFSCRKDTSPINPDQNVSYQITLMISDVEKTVVYMSITVEGVEKGQELVVLRKETEIYRAQPDSRGNWVHDSGLLPAHSYTYQARLYKDNRLLASSDAITATTLP